MFENTHLNDLLNEEVSFFGFTMYMLEDGSTPREIGEKILNLPQRPFERIGGFENSNAYTILQGLRLLQKQQDDQRGAENMRGKAVEEAYLQDLANRINTKELYKELLPFAEKLGQSVSDIIIEAFEVGLEQIKEEVENG